VQEIWSGTVFNHLQGLKFLSIFGRNEATTVDAPGAARLSRFEINLKLSCGKADGVQG
jgi:hypothetical protein